MKSIELILANASEADLEYLTTLGKPHTVDFFPEVVRPTFEAVFGNQSMKYVGKQFVEKTAKFCRRVFIRSDGNRNVRIHKDTFRKWFGSNENASKLKEYLLITVDEHYVSPLIAKPGQETYSKMYRLDMNAYRKLCGMFGVEVRSLDKSIKQDIRESYDEELKAQTFTMKSSSSHFRETHPLQNEPSEFRNEVLVEAGFVAELDITCCAVSCLIHHARIHRPLDVLLQDELLLFESNLDQWRLDRAKELEVVYLARTGKPHTDEICFKSVVKTFINSRIHGAVMLSRKENSIFTELCNSDKVLFYTIKDNRKLCRAVDQLIILIGLSKNKFKDDHRHLFDPQLVGKTRTDTNKKGRTTYMMYTYYEKQVRDLLIKKLDEQGIRYFNCHDGLWLTEQVDVAEMERAIHAELGIKIKLKMKNKLEPVDN